MKPRASLDLAGTAEFLKSGACKSVYVLTGAGASTGAGIPDFRSPGGMYDSLRPELITATEAQRKRMRMDPVNVVMKDMFFQNQFPYLEVRRPFILGTQQQQWKATLTHWFMRFLEEEGLLKRLFTQNIDGLDYQTGISRELVTNVHGSLARVSCEGCGYEMPFDDFCAQVRTNVKDIYRTDPTAPAESSNINCPRCNAPLVKPNTVLFGSSLPSEPLDCHCLTCMLLMPTSGFCRFNILLVVLLITCTSTILGMLRRDPLTGLAAVGRGDVPNSSSDAVSVAKVLRAAR